MRPLQNRHQVPFSRFEPSQTFQPSLMSDLEGSLACDFGFTSILTVMLLCVLFSYIPDSKWRFVADLRHSGLEHSLCGSFTTFKKELALFGSFKLFQIGTAVVWELFIDSKSTFWHAGSHS